MVAIFEVILAIAGILGIAISIFTPAGRKASVELVDNLFHGRWDKILPNIEDLSKDVGAIAKAAAKAIDTYGPPIAYDLATPFRVVARSLLEAQQGAMAPIGESTPDNALDAAGQGFAVAFGAGLAEAGVAALFEGLLPKDFKLLDDFPEFIGEMAGFKEVAHAVLHPLYHNAFGQSLEYHYRAKFKPELPSEGDAITWHARRLINDEQLRKIFHYSGLKDEYEPAYIKSAYRALPLFAMSRTIDDSNRDPTPLKELMRFSGYREEDIQTAIDAFRNLAFKSLRQEVLKSAEANFVAGIADEAALVRTMNSLDLSDEAKRLIELAATQKRLKVLADDYKRGWDYKAAAEEIDAQQYRIGLAGLGYTSPVIDALVSEMADRMSSVEFKAAAMAAREEEREDLRIGIRAAQTAFREGTIEAVGFTAALLALGVHPHTAAMYLALAEARGVITKAKKAVARTAAQKLEQKADIEQFRKNLIDEHTLLVKLRDDGMSEAEAAAELEYLNALAGKLSP